MKRRGDTGEFIFMKFSVLRTREAVYVHGAL